MLALSRRIGESVVINDDIRVTVVTVKRGKIRLGVGAPAFVRVDRLEVHDQRRASNLSEATHTEQQCACQPRAIVFDVDDASQACLREALSGWEFDIYNGAAASSVAANWNPSRADLLVLGVGNDNANFLGLCRFLTFCTFYSENFRPGVDAMGQPGKNLMANARADAPILVLVPPGQETLSQAALRAGAHSCLVLPIHHKDVTSMLARTTEGNQPGRHTLNLQHLQLDDLWRDDGGEG